MRDAAAPGASGEDANKGKKRTFSDQEGDQNAGKSAGEVGVTAESIMDMVKTAGADEPAKPAADEQQAPPHKRVAREERAAGGGGRVAREVYVPAAMRGTRGGADLGASGGSGVPASKPDGRTDGVRGRGANKFKAAVEEIAPPKEPPSAKPETCLRIEGLKRPFTDKQLKDKLEEVSEGEGATWMWLNRIKSVCMCEFSNEDQADAARRAMYDVQWPEATGGRLIVSFITVGSRLQNDALCLPLLGIPVPFHSIPPLVVVASIHSAGSDVCLALHAPLFWHRRGRMRTKLLHPSRVQNQSVHAWVSSHLAKVRIRPDRPYCHSAP